MDVKGHGQQSAFRISVSVQLHGIILVNLQEPFDALDLSARSRLQALFVRCCEEERMQKSPGFV